MMQPQHTIWGQWADSLKKWGMEGFAAWALDAGAPLGLLGAQLIYIGQPLLSPFLPFEHTRALAGLLEDRTEARAFINYLKNGAAS
jgi:hypothetical protein